MKNFFRVSTANYAPIKYKFGSSTYQQHFQQRQPFSTAFVIPYSRHRRNNPQPTMVNSYNYPDGVSLSHSDCLCVCLFSLHVRESKTVLDSAFPRCGFRIPGTGFLIFLVTGTWIPDSNRTVIFRKLSQLQKWSKNFRYRITPFMGLL